MVLDPPDAPLLPVFEPAAPVVAPVVLAGAGGVSAELAALVPVGAAPLECALVSLAVVITAVLAVAALRVGCAVREATLPELWRAAWWTTATFARACAGRTAVDEGGRGTNMMTLRSSVWAPNIDDADQRGKADGGDGVGGRLAADHRAEPDEGRGGDAHAGGGPGVCHLCRSYRRSPRAEHRHFLQRLRQRSFVDEERESGGAGGPGAVVVRQDSQ